MPYATKEAKHAWTKRAIRNGYGKWLYQKRKRVRLDAEAFRVALEEIDKVQDLSGAKRIARKALKDSTRRWSTLGPAHANGKVDVCEPEGDSLFEALSKLGLSQ